MIKQDTLEIFDKLYYDTYKEVLKYVICNCSNIEDVKDIIQNVYLDVYRNIKRIKKVNNYNSYILTITKNKVKDYYRFKYKHKYIGLNKEDNELIDTISTKERVEDIILINEDINMIWNYLAKKNVIISKIFYLYYYENVSLKEISEILNISLSNVKHYLYRTLKELNKLVNNGGENNVK